MGHGDSSGHYIRPALVALIKFKQYLGRLLVSTYYGYRLYIFVKGIPQLIRSQHEDRPFISKRAFDELTKQALDEFISSERKISFPISNETPGISIVVVTFNQSHLTLQCLKSLLRQEECTFELILVDNHSSDQTEAILDRVENIKIIRNSSNLGFVEAVNKGAEHASSEHLLLLNNDTVLLPNSLVNAHSVLKERNSFGAVGGRLILLNGQLQEAGCSILNDGSCVGIGRGDHPNASRYMHRRTVDFCSGAFLLTRRSLWNAIGGLDSIFSPAYYEDVDYCVEVRKRGYEVVYDPFSALLHYEFASSKNTESAMLLQRERRDTFVNKHMGQFQNDGALKVCESSERKSILFIDDRVPYPSLGAGYPRSYSMLKSLHALGFSVTLYPMMDVDEFWTSIYELLPRSVEVALPGGQLGLLRFLKARKHQYDLVVISREHNFRFSSRLVLNSNIWKGDVHLVYDAEALFCEREILQREIQDRPLSARKKHKLRSRELGLAKKATSIISVCEAEARSFREAGCGDVHVIGHCFSIPYVEIPFDQRRDFLFVGALRDDDSPNVDSLIWFCQNVFPIVKRSLGSNVKLFVVGEASAPTLRRIGDPSVVFEGRVKDIEHMYKRCRVFIAPTRFAAGVPHKVHEAAAMGIPCVVTNLLLKQLGWTHGKETMSADSIGEFAQHCEKLYTDETMWKSVRKHARLAVERDCASSKFARSLEQTFAKYLS